MHTRPCAGKEVKRIRTYIKAQRINAIREKAEEGFTEMKNCPNGFIRLVKYKRLTARNLKEEDVREGMENVFWRKSKR